MITSAENSTAAPTQECYHTDSFQFPVASSQWNQKLLETGNWQLATGNWHL